MKFLSNNSKILVLYEKTITEKEREKIDKRFLFIDNVVRIENITYDQQEYNGYNYEIFGRYAACLEYIEQNYNKKLDLNKIKNVLSNDNFIKDKEKNYPISFSI